MKVLVSAVFAVALLAGCISSNPASPPDTTVVAPQSGGSTCENGNPPPCD